MQINGAGPLVVRAVVILGLVIAQILLSRIISYFENSLCLVTQQPKISHIHRSRTLPLDGVIEDSDGSGVVDMDGGRWLRVAHVL